MLRCSAAVLRDGAAPSRYEVRGAHDAVGPAGPVGPAVLALACRCNSHSRRSRRRVACWWCSVPVALTAPPGANHAGGRRRRWCRWCWQWCCPSRRYWRCWRTWRRCPYWQCWQCCPYWRCSRSVAVLPVSTAVLPFSAGPAGARRPAPRGSRRGRPARPGPCPPGNHDRARQRHHYRHSIGTGATEITKATEITEITETRIAKTEIAKRTGTAARATVLRPHHRLRNTAAHANCPFVIGLLRARAGPTSPPPRRSCHPGSLRPTPPATTSKGPRPRRRSPRRPRP